jgi:hypothetical protein
VDEHLAAVDIARIEVDGSTFEKLPIVYELQSLTNQTALAYARQSSQSEQPSTVLREYFVHNFEHVFLSAEKPRYLRRCILQRNWLALVQIEYAFWERSKCLTLYWMILSLVHGELTAFVIELGLLKAHIGLSPIGVVIIRQQLKDLGLRRIVDANDHLCMLIGLVYWHVLFEQHGVERVCEGENCKIFHFFRLLDADDVLGSGLEEDASNKFRVTRGHNDELQLAVYFGYHFLESLS